MALHAIVTLSRLVTENDLPHLLPLLGKDPRQSAAVVKSLQLAESRLVEPVIHAINTASDNQRSWLIYLLACWGRGVCEARLKEHAPSLLNEVNAFWSFHNENWLNNLETADQLDLLRSQVSKPQFIAK